MVRNNWEPFDLNLSVSSTRDDAATSLIKHRYPLVIKCVWLDNPI